MLGQPVSVAGGVSYEPNVLRLEVLDLLRWGWQDGTITATTSKRKAESFDRGLRNTKARKLLG